MAIQSFYYYKLRITVQIKSMLMRTRHYMHCTLTDRKKGRKRRSECPVHIAHQHRFYLNSYSKLIVDPFYFGKISISDRIYTELSQNLQCRIIYCGLIPAINSLQYFIQLKAVLGSPAFAVMC